MPDMWTCLTANACRKRNDFRYTCINRLEVCIVCIRFGHCSFFKWAIQIGVNVHTIIHITRSPDCLHLNQSKSWNSSCLQIYRSHLNLIVVCHPTQKNESVPTFMQNFLFSRMSPFFSIVSLNWNFKQAWRIPNVTCTVCRFTLWYGCHSAKLQLTFGMFLHWESTIVYRNMQIILLSLININCEY